MAPSAATRGRRILGIGTAGEVARPPPHEDGGSMPEKSKRGLGDATALNRGAPRREGLRPPQGTIDPGPGSLGLGGSVMRPRQVTVRHAVVVASAAAARGR